MTPTIVITGFDEEYEGLRKIKELEAVFCMPKNAFDEIELLKIIDREVSRIDFRFYDDHRQS
jgi:hypothetical protein